MTGWLRRWWPHRVADAERRAEESERKLEVTMRRDTEVRQVAERLATLRKRNQFAEMMAAAFRDAR